MNEEMNFETRTEETPETNQVETSKGGSGLFKIGLGLAVGAVAGATAFGAKKLKARKEKRKELDKEKTIEELRKEGWTIEEPESSKENDEEAASEEEVPDEE